MSNGSKRERVLSWFLRSELPIGVIHFDELISRAASNALGIDQPEADKYVQSNRLSLWKYFSQNRNTETKKGIFPVVYIVDQYARRIESAPSRLMGRSDKKSTRLSGRLAMRPHIYRAIEDLSDRAYEALCCLACKKLGAHKFHLTPKGNEGGIDFLALVEGPHSFPKCSGLNRLRIVGQAKKLSTPVQVGAVRELNDTLVDVRRRSPLVKEHIPSWFRDNSGPIIGLLVGHKGFQSGSETKARMNGITLIDSQSLTELIAFSPDTGSRESGEIVAKRMLCSCQEILKYHSQS